MRNARNGFGAAGLALALALIGGQPAFAGDNAGAKQPAPKLDLNAKLQQKLSAQMSGKLNDAGDDALDSKLSERVEEKNEAVNEQLDEQARSLTAADRGEEKKEVETEAKAGDSK